jgi:tRNA(fMet)-specific endonuclease VapC
VRVALDTNRYVDLCKGERETVDLLTVADAVFLPFVVVAELRAGFALGRRSAENERILRRFLLGEGVGVLYAVDQTTHHYARVFRQLRTQGTPIPTNDLWVAALVLQRDLALHDRDRHFDHLPQLVRVEAP